MNHLTPLLFACFVSAAVVLVFRLLRIYWQMLFRVVFSWCYAMWLLLISLWKYEIADFVWHWIQWRKHCDWARWSIDSGCKSSSLLCQFTTFSAVVETELYRLKFVCSCKRLSYFFLCTNEIWQQHRLFKYLSSIVCCSFARNAEMLPCFLMMMKASRHIRQQKLWRH